MEDIFLNKDEETQNVDGCIVNTPEETPVVISEPEPTEVTPSVEPNTTVIPEEPIDPVLDEIPQSDVMQSQCDCPECQGDCQQSCGCCNIENLTIGEFFGTLMESVQAAWRFHLQAKKHSSHVILEEYYDEAQDIVDKIIENYQGRYGTVIGYNNRIIDCGRTDVDYFRELRDFVDCGKMVFPNLVNASELMSDIDSLVSLIDSTLYKLTTLTESNKPFKTFEEFISK